MKSRMVFLAIAVSIAAFSFPFSAGARQFLHDHVPEVIAHFHLQPIGRLPATNRLHLAIGLPSRNKEALDELLKQLYDPASTNYHHYLTPQQFADTFGPTEQDYQKVIALAKTSGLEVFGTYSNRMLLDVSGKVSDIESAFHVTLMTYRHPFENRNFFAPDVEPSLDLSVPILHIAGLNNYIVPRRASARTSFMGQTGNATAAGGTGPHGYYMGNDFRKAYTPGVQLTGSGQVVGLLEFGGYYKSDITNYESLAGQSNVPIQNILLDGFNGTDGNDKPEAAVDIEMVISMAPGLSNVVVYEAPNVSIFGLSPAAIDILHEMAYPTHGETLPKQLSSSWCFGNSSLADQYYQEFAAQGQSFFQSSGDYGAYYWGVLGIGDIGQWADDTNVTIVGGTVLTTGSDGSWASETTWNDGYDTNVGHYWASGGGVSSHFQIPTWQQGIDMSSNGGSTSMRNVPDVSMVADDIWGIFNNGTTGEVFGTSFAAPLWAGFMALVNQQAQTNEEPTAGFINPAIYSIGKGPNYSSAFHDVADGSDNHNVINFNGYKAVAGYDLCTGWGTPNGTNLINLLAPPPQLSVSPTSGFNSSGSQGGPFNPVAQQYSLNNTGAGTLTWTANADQNWVTLFPSSGQNSGAVMVFINTNADSLSNGTYYSTVTFAGNGGTITRQVQLTVASIVYGQWIRTSAIPNDAYSVASSSDGTKLVAAIQGWDEILTSTDSGAIWTQTSAPSEVWYAVASSSDGTKLVAVSYPYINGIDGTTNGGWIYMSADSGATWTQTSAPNETWWSVASSSDGTKLVAVAFGGGIYTSADSGATWTQTSAPSHGWYAVACSADGTKLVAVAGDVYGEGIYTSTNSGATWKQNSAPDEEWYSVASSLDGTKLVAAARPFFYNGGIYTSADSGATWTQASVPSEVWYSVASSSDGSKLVAVANGGGIYTSADSGTTWTQTGAPSDDWQSVASSSDGTKLVAASSWDGIYTFASVPSQVWAIALGSSPVAGGSTAGSGSYTNGQSVTISATPNPYFNFVDWTENGTEISSLPSFAFVVTNSQVFVANFSPQTFTINTSSSPSDGGTTSGGGTINGGANVAVIASANSCYSFVNWTENGTVVCTTPYYPFTVSSNRNLVANFTPTTYTISTSSSPSGGGSTGGGGMVECGSNVTVCATASTGYSFANWTIDGDIVSTSSCFTFTPSTSVNLVANFVLTNPLASLGFQTNGAFRMAFYGEIGGNYTLQASTDLKNWTTLFNFTCTNLPTILVDAAAKNFSQRFYRVTQGAVVFSVTLGFSSSNSWTTNGVALTLQGPIDSNYVIQVSTDLVNWQPVMSFFVTNSPFYFSVPLATNSNRGFYRAVLP